MTGKDNPIAEIDRERLDEIILSTVLGKHRDMIESISPQMRLALDLVRQKLIEHHAGKAKSE